MSIRWVERDRLLHEVREHVHRVDTVLDIGCGDTGGVDRAADRRGSELIRGKRAEGALEGSDRRALRAQDDDLSHFAPCG